MNIFLWSFLGLVCLVLLTIASFLLMFYLDAKKQSRELLKDFPETYHRELAAIFQEFPLAQIFLINYFLKAYTVGLLPRAIRAVKEQFETHWCFKPPQDRGLVITGQDKAYLRKLYTGLGLEIPSDLR